MYLPTKYRSAYNSLYVPQLLIEVPPVALFSISPPFNTSPATPGNYEDNQPFQLTFTGSGTNLTYSWKRSINGAAFTQFSTVQNPTFSPGQFHGIITSGFELVIQLTVTNSLGSDVTTMGGILYIWYLF